VAAIPKVPEEQFKAVVSALLNTPPMPMAEIPRKAAAESGETLSQEARLV
jgi:hypothetical protein